MVEGDPNQLVVLIRVDLVVVVQEVVFLVPELPVKGIMVVMEMVVVGLIGQVVAAAVPELLELLLYWVRLIDLVLVEIV